MSGPEAVFAALLVILGAGTLVCVAGWWWAGRKGPSTGEQEAAVDAAPCCQSTALWGEHDVWCSCRPGQAVVAGSDLDPLEALYRAPAFGGERVFRVPGEGR